MKLYFTYKNFDYRKYTKTIEKFVVLAAWIAVYVGFYFATKDSSVTHQMKARSVDRMGLLPPYSGYMESEETFKNRKEQNNAR